MCIFIFLHVFRGFVVFLFFRDLRSSFFFIFRHDLNVRVLFTIFLAFYFSCFPSFECSMFFRAFSFFVHLLHDFVSHVVVLFLRNLFS